jgi:uncharacterized SAM-binding protein YcdF (DUF218 family)
MRMLPSTESTKTQPAPHQSVTRRGFGMLVRKERWGLSWPGKLVLILALCLGGLGVVKGAYPFLATTRPVSTKTMVVEGWLPPSVVQQLANRYAAREYQQIVIPRGLFRGRSAYESGEFAANYMAESLVQLGVPKDRVHVLFFDSVKVDRTYHSALAVKKWYRERGEQIGSMELVTMGPHARRSRLLFRKALGNEVKIGVLALEDDHYDAQHWWRSSAGVREVPFELIAYIYAKFFFSAG